MQKSKIPLYVARTIIIGIVFLLLLLSLDVFVEDYKWYEKLGGFLIHNIPTLVILVIFLIAEKKPYIGGVLLLILATFEFFFFKVYEHFGTFFIIILPVIIAGILYLFWGRSIQLKKRKSIQSSSNNND